MDTPRLTLYITNPTWVPNATNSFVPVNQPVDGLYLSHMTMFFLLSFLAHLTIVVGNWSQGLPGGEGDCPTARSPRGGSPPAGTSAGCTSAGSRCGGSNTRYASLMAITISVASGVNHAYMITFIFTLMWCTMVFGYYTEIISRPKMRGVLKLLRWKISWRRPETLLFPGLAAAIGTDKLERLAPTSWAMCSITVGPCCSTASSTTSATAARASDFVYIIVVGQLVVFTGLGSRNCSTRASTTARRYYWGEWSYLFLPLLQGAVGAHARGQRVSVRLFDEAVANAD